MQTSTNQPEFINPHTMYRAKDCARFFSVGLSTWWHWQKIGKAPIGNRIGPRTTVWTGEQLLNLRAQLLGQTQA